MNVLIDYTNHRGERAWRRICPQQIIYNRNEWHPERQWLLVAYDFDKKAERVFAMAMIHEWKPNAVAPTQRPITEMDMD